MELTGYSRSENKEIDMVPCILYGKNIAENIEFAITKSSAVKLYNTMVNEKKRNHVITLNIQGMEYTTVLHELQQHPVKNHVLHMDFLSIDETVSFKQKVRIDFLNQNTAPVTKMSKIMCLNKEISVLCKGTNTISTLACDLNDLMPGKMISAFDLKVDSNIKILYNTPIIAAKKKKEVPVKAEGKK